MWVVLAVVGTALLLLGSTVAVLRIWRAWTWASARAEIVGLEKKQLKRAVGKLVECRWVYHPRLRFRDATGSEREIVLDLGDGTVGANEESVGVILPIRYDLADPSRAVVWEPLVVWLPPTAAMFGGGVALALAYCFA